MPQIAKHPIIATRIRRPPAPGWSWIDRRFRRGHEAPGRHPTIRRRGPGAGGPATRSSLWEVIPRRTAPAGLANRSRPRRPGCPLWGDHPGLAPRSA